MTDAAFAALTAAAGLDDRRRGLYADLVWGALNEATRQAIEARMAQSEYQYQSEFARTYFAQGEASGEAKGRVEGEAKGRAEGKAKAVLTVLATRGLRVTAAQRERVLGCTDLEQREGWVRRAVTVKTTTELFAAPKRPAKARRGSAPSRRSRPSDKAVALRAKGLARQGGLASTKPRP